MSTPPGPSCKQASQAIMSARVRAAAALASTMAVTVFLAACGGSSGGRNESTGTSLTGSSLTATAAATAALQVRSGPLCPQDAPDALNVAVEHRWTWSACTNDAGTIMYVYNISEDTLLASPYPGATLPYPGATLQPGIVPPNLSVGDAMAHGILSVLTARYDSQVNGQIWLADNGWIYIPPQSYIRVTSPFSGGAGVYLRTDYYATIQYTVARALGDYLNDKVTPKPFALWNALLDCEHQLNVTAEMVNNPPPLVNVVEDLVRAGSSCYDAIKSLDPDAPQAATNRWAEAVTL